MRPYLIIITILIVALAAIFGLGGYVGTSTESTTQRAIVMRDPRVCDSLESRHEEPPGPPEYDGKGAVHVTYPRNSCLSAYLRATKDRQVCELFDPRDNDGSNDPREFCYQFIADVYQDPAACEKIPDSPHLWKSLPICLAVAKRDVRECDALNEMDKILSYSSKTDCILAVVKRTRDASICDGITGPGYGSFDPAATAGYKNECLKISWCDKPEKRQEFCAQVQYPSWVLQEEKAQCLTEKWECSPS